MDQMDRGAHGISDENRWMCAFCAMPYVTGQIELLLHDYLHTDLVRIVRDYVGLQSSDAVLSLLWSNIAVWQYASCVAAPRIQNISPVRQFFLGIRHMFFAWLAAYCTNEVIRSIVNTSAF